MYNCHDMRWLWFCDLTSKWYYPKLISQAFTCRRLRVRALFQINKMSQKILYVWFEQGYLSCIASAKQNKNLRDTIIDMLKSTYSFLTTTAVTQKVSFARHFKQRGIPAQQMARHVAAKIKNIEPISKLLATQAQIQLNRSYLRRV